MLVSDCDAIETSDRKHATMRLSWGHCMMPFTVPSNPISHSNSCVNIWDTADFTYNDVCHIINMLDLLKRWKNDEYLNLCCTHLHTSQTSTFCHWVPFMNSLSVVLEFISSVFTRDWGTIHVYNNIKSNLLHRLPKCTLQTNPQSTANYHVSLSVPAFPQRPLQMPLLRLWEKLLFLAPVMSPETPEQRRGHMWYFQSQGGRGWTCAKGISVGEREEAGWQWEMGTISARQREDGRGGLLGIEGCEIILQGWQVGSTVTLMDG